MHAEKIGHGEEEGIEVRGASRRGRFAGGEDEGVSKGDLLRGLTVEERVGLRKRHREWSRRQHRADEVVGENLQAAEEEGPASPEPTGAPSAATKRGPPEGGIVSF